MCKMQTILAVLLASACFSCSHDAGPGAPNAAEAATNGAISFSANDNDRPDTRYTGEVTTSGIQEMAIFAYHTTNAWTNQDKLNLMYNQKVERNSANDTWTYTPTKYWGPGYFSFFAVTPQPSATNGITTLTAENGTGYPAFKLEPPASPQQQEDICVATPVMNATGTGTVSLGFRHALAKISFLAKYTATGTQDVYIDTIKLTGVAGSATLAFTGTDYTLATSGTTGAYVLTATDGELATTKITTSFAPISTPGGTLCLLPQTIPAEARLTVHYRVGEFPAISTVALQSGTWVAGNDYQYQLDLDIVSQVWNFTYQANAQQFTAPKDGYYKLEVWGATYNTHKNPFPNGAGYSKGMIFLKKDQKLYAYTGKGGTSQIEVAEYLFNGGGGQDNNKDMGGGGGSDFRLVSGGTNWADDISLNSRIIVAGGHGGADASATNAASISLGYGGGLTGGAGTLTSGSGGGQTGAGTTSGSNMVAGGFGKGGRPGSSSDYRTWTRGGGGGYYGGGAYRVINTGPTAAGGGSSFISGYTGCRAIDPTSTSNPRATDDGTNQAALNYNDNKFGPSPTWNNGDEIIFTQMQMLAGNENQTLPGGTVRKGNDSDGHCRITYVGPGLN